MRCKRVLIMTLITLILTLNFSVASFAASGPGTFYIDMGSNVTTGSFQFVGTGSFTSESGYTEAGFASGTNSSRYPYTYSMNSYINMGTILGTRYWEVVVPSGSSITGVDTWSGQNKTGSLVSKYIVLTTKPDATPPGDVIGLVETHTDTTVTLSWTNSTEAKFNGTKLYKGSTYLNSFSKTVNSNTLSGLTPSTPYTFQITSIGTNNIESKGTSIKVTTSAPSEPPIPLVRGENMLISGVLIVNYADAKNVRKSDILPYSYSSSK